MQSRYTIEDAYRSTLTDVVPQLLAAKLPVTIFATPDRLDRGGEFVNWAELKALATRGATIGARLPGSIGPEADEAQLTADLNRTLSRMRDELGQMPTMLALPAGPIHPSLPKLLETRGLLAAFGQQSGPVFSGSDRWQLPRFTMTEAVGNADRFRIAISSLPLPVREIVPRQRRAAAGRRDRFHRRRLGRCARPSRLFLAGFGTFDARTSVGDARRVARKRTVRARSGAHQLHLAGDRHALALVRSHSSGPSLSFAAKSHPTPAHLLLATMIAVIWGTNFVAIRWGLDYLPPFLFVALRFGVAALACLFVPRPLVSWRLMIAAGVVMLGGQFGFMFLAIHHGMPPGLASVLIQAQVPITIVLAALLQRELPTSAQFGAMLLAIVGLAIIALDLDADVSLLAFFLMMAAATCWASGNQMIRAMGQVNAFALISWMSLFAVPPTLLLSLLFETMPAMPDAHGVAVAGFAIFYNAVISTLGRLWRLGMAVGALQRRDGGAVCVAGAGGRRHDVGAGAGRDVRHGTSCRHGAAGPWRCGQRVSVPSDVRTARRRERCACGCFA